MFDKTNKKKETDPFGKINRIAEGTVIEGHINSQADFRMDGELIGNFKSTGKLVIGVTGKIIGDIICVNADIEGKLIGKIEVSEVLNVKSKANMQGDVIVSKLSIEQGASFNVASCTMKQDTFIPPFDKKESERSKEKTV